MKNFYHLICLSLADKVTSAFDACVGSNSFPISDSTKIRILSDVLTVKTISWYFSFDEIKFHIRNGSSKSKFKLNNIQDAKLNSLPI